MMSSSSSSSQQQAGDMGGDGDCPSSSSNCSAPSPPQLKLYQAFIFVTPIVFTIVLLLLFCCLYIRRRRQHMRATTQIRAQFFTRGLFSAPLEQGLNKSFRDGLPVLVYNEAFATSRDDTQCAVCLGDYQNSEKLLQLPVCGHAFHKECIDQWLVNNATCPICRTSLLQFGKVVPMNSPAQTPAALQICGRRPLTIQVLSGTASSYDTVLGSNRSDGVRLEFFPDDGTSGCSSGTTNVLFTADTNHQSHPSMEEVIEQDDIADGEHGIQIDH